MTRQEIREGLALRLHTKDRTWLRMLDETNPRNCMWEDLPFNLKLEYRDEAIILSKYLDSQDVKIVKQPQQGSDLTGCVIVAVEPLLKEE